MEFTTLLPWLVFGAASVGVWALISLLSPKQDRATERLDSLRKRNNGELDEFDTGDEKQTAVGAALKKAAPKLSKALEPKSELEQSELKVRMANAGYTSPNASQLFLGVKVICLIVGLVLGGGFGAVKYGLTQSSLMSLFIGGGIGFYFPGIILRIQASGRKERIFLSLPDALDLLVVCVEAGLGLDAGMQRVSEELRESAPDVCDEFHLCNVQLQMGKPRREVLHDMGIRTGVDDMRALVAILIQADRFGASIAQALRVQSDSMRVKRSQMAEEKAQQTAVKMIFPLVLFIFPGIFVVLVGPAAIMLMNGLLNK